MFRQAIRNGRKRLTRLALQTTVLVGVVEVTTNLPSQGRSSKFYHTLSDDYGTPFLRTVLGPEEAHQAAVTALKYNVAPTHRPSATEQQLKDSGRVPFLNKDKILSNPIGIAAGFDKNAEAIQPLFDLGCGFVEIGSVTVEPQPGNPKPRMFRLVEDQGVINRCGFNGVGAQAVLQNLQEYRASSNQVLGINLGKNKIPSRETPLEEYQELIQMLGPHADYLVVNVSSPNTPGLRDLQEPDTLRALLQGCIASRDALLAKLEEGFYGRPIPLLVKLAPDLSLEEMESIAEVLLEVGIDGIILTNTSNQRPKSNSTVDNTLLNRHRNETGGLSGQPIKDLSTDRIRTMYKLTKGAIPIIGVGGIASGHDAYEKICAGASFVQLYTGMIYGGPGLLSRIRHELAAELVENGHRSIQDAIAIDHGDLYWQKQQLKMTAGSGGLDPQEIDDTES